MYKEKCVKIQNSREIRESLIKISLSLENKYTQTRTHVVICFHFSIFEPLETVERIQTVLQKLL